MQKDQVLQVLVPNAYSLRKEVYRDQRAKTALSSGCCLILFCNYNHGQKSWDTFGFLGRFPIHTGPTPPLTPQTMLDACIQNFFRVSTLYRVRGGRTARKFRKGCTALRGKLEMTEKNEYCSTVPRTFVQDCSKNSSEKLFGFLVLSYLVYRIQFHQFTCILLLFNY